MKYLIVGLGNVGRDYDNTRHNIGFDVVDQLAKDLKIEWSLDRHAFMAEGKYKGKTYILLKPTTYMNLSGVAIKYWLDKEKIPLENLMVILDDLNLPLGKLRIRKKGSSGGHNGLKNIEAKLQTVDYPRLRVGIGADFRDGHQVDFVLGTWKSNERALVDLVIQESAEAMKSFSFIGLDRTMNVYNAKEISLKID